MNKAKVFVEQPVRVDDRNAQKLPRKQSSKTEPTADDPHNVFELVPDRVADRVKRTRKSAAKASK